MEKIHEVAIPLQLDLEGKDYRRDYSENDYEYRRYTRILRTYDRFMPYRNHRCWNCEKWIDAGHWYKAHVWIARPAVYVHQLKREATFWVEKYHYPECPDRLREFEEEMLAATEREERERQLSEKKAA